jgi:hypothetical protein
LAQGQSAQEKLTRRPVARAPAGTFRFVYFFFLFKKNLAPFKMTLDLSSSIIKHFYKFYFFPVFPFLSSQAFQLPRQDLALAYCRYVEPQNHTSYQDFVAARNGIIIHRGKKKI